MNEIQWKAVDATVIEDYLNNKTCFNCGGHNIQCFKGISEMGSTELLITCTDCNKAIRCDFVDGVKM